MLYGRKCRAPIGWDQVGERVIEGPEMIEVTNVKVVVAKEKLKEARTRQKSYADKHRRSLEFQPGDHVFMKVSPTRGVRRFGIKGKLSPRFIGPFEILDRVGEVSYRLALPPQLSHVHDVFHVSLLRGYKYHPLHVITYPLDQIPTDLSYEEEPEAIIDRQDRIMRKKTVPFSHEEKDYSFRQDSLEEPSRAGSHLGNRGVYPDFLSLFPSMIWNLDWSWRVVAGQKNRKTRGMVRCSCRRIAFSMIIWAGRDGTGHENERPGVVVALSGAVFPRPFA
nr:putative nucleotidyltransferase, ribonuclease H [Tanacetum cinerariifolium]